MRITKYTRIGWALAVLLALPLAASAQGNFPEIESNGVRLGLPSGGDETSGRTRYGAWMPVYVKIKLGKKAVGPGDLNLVVEANDADETPFRIVTPLPALAAAPGPDYFAVTYVRASGGEYQLTLTTADGRRLDKSQTPYRINGEPLNGTEPLILALGGLSPASLKKSLRPAVPGPITPEKEATLEAVASKHYALLGSVNDMPEHWYGYDAVDVVVLMTDSDTFLTALLNAKTRRQALVEWVRRGGKLVISVANKAAIVSELLESMALPSADKDTLLNCEIDNTRVRRKTLRSLNAWITIPPDQPLQNVEIAKLKPGPGTRVLLTEPAESLRSAAALHAVVGSGIVNMLDAEPRPLIVDAPCGLGRVMLVAFDLDARPFTDWQGQEALWKHLCAEVGPDSTLTNQNAEAPNFRQGKGGGFNFDSGPPELLRQMRSNVESFEQVPVIHFGFVALFIGIYILLVGPLDYLILAKVFKRLELTWVTFPAVVLTLSVGAYFGAYALKGDKRRFNKVDLVEIDLRGDGQAYGTSWFAIFSPRIENYTIGVEPIFPDPDAERNGLPYHSAVTTVLEAEGINTMNTSSHSLFDRPYEYAPAVSGLKKVPIPVWSTRSFTATWRAPLPKKRPILATASDDPEDVDNPTLTRQGVVIGRITNNLPVTLKDITLFYHGRWYEPKKTGSLQNGLAPGASFPVLDLEMKDGSGRERSSWQAITVLQDEGGQMGHVATLPGQNDWRDVKRLDVHQLVKSMMFHGKANSEFNNGNLRRLDQEWRLRDGTESGRTNQPSPYLEEVILVARTAFVPQEDSQKVNEKSLVKLWVGELPKADAIPPALAGQTTEDTFVRVYIPVRARK